MARMMVGQEISFTVDKEEANPGETVLEVKDLSVNNVDGVEAVKNVSFTIHSGEIFALAGVSGNGQNEQLVDAIAGLVPCQNGTILLNGKDITGASIRDRIEAGISYIPEDRQDVGLVMGYNLKNNLALKKYYDAADLPLCHRGQPGCRNLYSVSGRCQSLLCLFESYTGLRSAA